MIQRLSYDKKVIYFPDKRMKGIFVYVLVFMLTLDTLCKIQNISTLMCAKVRNLRAEHFESYSSFSYFTHIILYCILGVLPSDQVIDCIHIDCT